MKMSLNMRRLVRRYHIHCNCNNHNVFRSFYNSIESRSKSRFKRYWIIICAVLIMFGGMLLFAHFIYHDRIKILILDKQEDLEDNFIQGFWKIDKSWNFKQNATFSKHSKPSKGSSASKNSIDILKHESSFGFWVACNQNYREDFVFDNSFKITLANFQYMYPIETTLGLRFFIEGEARIEIIFRDALHWNMQSYVISTSSIFSDTSKTEAGAAGNALFCSHIVPLTFNGIIDKIEIKGTIQNDKDIKSFIAVDKIITTMGKHGGSRNLMNTMMPTNWCNAYRYKYTWHSVIR